MKLFRSGNRPKTRINDLKRKDAEKKAKKAEAKKAKNSSNQRKKQAARALKSCVNAILKVIMAPIKLASVLFDGVDLDGNPASVFRSQGQTVADPQKNSISTSSSPSTSRSGSGLSSDRSIYSGKTTKQILEDSQNARSREKVDTLAQLTKQVEKTVTQAQSEQTRTLADVWSKLNPHNPIKPGSPQAPK